MGAEHRHIRSMHEVEHPLWGYKSFTKTAIFQRANGLFFTPVRRDDSEMHDGTDFLLKVDVLGLRLEAFEVRDIQRDGARTLKGVRTQLHPMEGTIDVVTDTGEVFAGLKIEEYRFMVDPKTEFDPEKSSVVVDVTPEGRHMLIGMRLSIDTPETPVDHK